ncbi:MAG: hypothetical protein ACYDD0_04020 [Candidatus Dormibacteria bacterium]
MVATNSPAQRVKTLAHEIAHEMVHAGQSDRQLAELEPESTACVVCQSLGYVASWAGGGEQAVAGIKASSGRIQETASAILRAFEPAGSEEAGLAASSTTATTFEAHLRPSGRGELPLPRQSRRQ